MPLLAIGEQFEGRTVQRLLHDGTPWRYSLASVGDQNSVCLAELLPADYEDVEARMRARQNLRHPLLPALRGWSERVPGEIVATYDMVWGANVANMIERAPLPAPVAAKVVHELAQAIADARVSPGWCNWAGLEPQSLHIVAGGQLRWTLPAHVEVPLNITGAVPTRSRSMAYMAPEAVNGLPLIPESTVFSLGILLYELATGVHPFRGSDLFRTMASIRSATFTAPTDVHRIPEPLAKVILQCLREVPEERLPMPKAVAEALEGVGRADADEVLEHALTQDPNLSRLFDGAHTVASEPARESPEASLLQAVADDRDNREPYLVLADWLQDQQDPRGELIVLQNQLKQATALERRALLDRQAEILRRHPHLLGRLKLYLMHKELDRLHHFEPCPHFVGNPQLGPLAVSWFQGYLRSVRIAFREGVLEPNELSRVLMSIEELESARFLAGLTVGTFLPHAVSQFRNCAPIYEALASSRLNLNSLYVGSLGSLSPFSDHFGVSNVCAVFENLERLALRGGRMHLGRMRLDHLRELRLFSSGMEAETISQLASSSLPSLKYLELWLGGAPARSAWPDRLVVLFNSDAMPKLEELVISETHPGALPATIAVLSESPIAARLKTLDVLHSTEREAAVEALIRCSSRFPQLRFVHAGRVGDALVARVADQPWVLAKRDPKR